MKSPKESTRQRASQEEECRTDGPIRTTLIHDNRPATWSSCLKCTFRALHCTARPITQTTDTWLHIIICSAFALYTLFFIPYRFAAVVSVTSYWNENLIFWTVDKILHDYKETHWSFCTVASSYFSTYPHKNRHIRSGGSTVIFSNGKCSRGAQHRSSDCKKMFSSSCRLELNCSFLFLASQE